MEFHAPPTIVNIGGTLYITGMELVPPATIPRYDPALFAGLTAQYEARPKDSDNFYGILIDFLYFYGII